MIGQIGFVILNYNTFEFLKGLVEELLTKQNRKIVVIDNFSNPEERSRVIQFCKAKEIICLPRDNDGYGAGNNAGLLAAVDAFKCDYYVVMNPDMMLGAEDFSELVHLTGAFVAGPKIITNQNKNQNPYWVFKSRLAEWLIYTGVKREVPLITFAGIGWHKIIKVIANGVISHRKVQRTFALHGACLIFSAPALRALGIAVFDEKIFLYTEEEDLAYKCQAKGIPQYYMPTMSIRHFEDGSPIEVGKTNRFTRESILYRYKKWHSRS